MMSMAVIIKHFFLIDEMVKERVHEDKMENCRDVSVKQLLYSLSNTAEYL